MKTPKEIRERINKGFLIYCDDPHSFNTAKYQVVGDFTHEQYMQAKKDKFFNIHEGLSVVSIFPKYMCFVEGNEEWDSVNGVRDGK